MEQVASDISVIICAYTEERWDDLVAAVESIRRQTLRAKEIIIVIDHNLDLLLRVREHMPDVVAIENREAKGASGARNNGVNIAQGSVLAFLDDDAIAEPNWLMNISTCYKNPDIIGVGGKIEPFWPEQRPFWFPNEFNWVVGCTYQGMPSRNSPVRNVIGANMSVRKDILLTVGGFRASFGNNKEKSSRNASFKWLKHHAGDEETELCIRVTKQWPNSIWLYTTSACVRHRVPRQRTRLAYFLWRCYDEGLGKAILASLHGTQISLASERSYTFKVLPRGVLHGLIDTLFHHDLTGLARAGAIVGGLTATIAGYMVGNTFLREAKSGNTAMLEAHLSYDSQVSLPGKARR